MMYSAYNSSNRVSQLVTVDRPPALYTTRPEGALLISGKNSYLLVFANCTMANLKISTSMLVGRHELDWSEHLCCSCKCLPNNAVRTSCGHIHCLECAKQLFTRTVPRCPREECTKPLIGHGAAILFPDRLVRRAFSRLSVKCVNHPKGCTWTGKVHELKEHHKSCQLGKVKCPICSCWITPRTQHESCSRQQVSRDSRRLTSRTIYDSPAAASSTTSERHFASGMQELPVNK